MHSPNPAPSHFYTACNKVLKVTCSELCKTSDKQSCDHYVLNQWFKLNGVWKILTGCKYGLESYQKVQIVSSHYTLHSLLCYSEIAEASDGISSVYPEEQPDFIRNQERHSRGRREDAAA